MNKTILKGLAGLMTSCAALSVYAIGDGMYLGGMVGYGVNQNKKIDVPSATTEFTVAQPRSQQYGGRIFVGNQLNRYAAIELGGTYFSPINYNYYAYDGVKTNIGSQRVKGVDLVGKGMFPLRMFNVFGRAGLAYISRSKSGRLNYLDPANVPYATMPGFDANGKAINIQVIPGTTTMVGVGSSASTNKVTGTFGFGASYDFTQTWQIEFSANYLMVGGDVGNVTMYALGISYHFTNVYCGQFLCDD